MAGMLGLAVVMAPAHATEPAAGEDGSAVMSPDCEDMRQRAQASGEAVPLEEAAVQIMPVLQEAVAPVYPRAARLAGTQGRVLLELLLTAQGEVADVCVQGATPPATGFEQAAAAAAQQRQYKPGRRKGQPVSMYLREVIAFRVGAWDSSVYNLLDQADVSDIDCPQEVSASLIKSPSDRVICGETDASFNVFQVRLTKAAETSTASGRPIKPAMAWKQDGELYSRAYGSHAGVMGVMFSRGQVVVIKGAEPEKKEEDEDPLLSAEFSCGTMRRRQEAGELPPATRGVDAPVLESDVTTPPVLLQKVQPLYPELARKAGIQAVVHLDAVVTPEGTTTEVCASGTSAPDLGFEEAAVKAVRQWQYSPGKLNGVPVPVFFNIAVQFTLSQ